MSEIKVDSAEMQLARLQSEYNDCKNNFDYLCEQGWFQEEAEFRLGLKNTETIDEFKKEIILSLSVRA